MDYLDQLEIMFSEEKEYAAENPVTHAIFVSMIENLQSINKAGIDWETICHITLASAAYCFFKTGGTAEDFINKLSNVNITPDNIDIN
tara:strand:+ start:934 stop:1197 length:264 start_codon:yes stop_codon:yes gene_type:complete